MSRAKQTLPNGYCGRPLQQACPHPNACLSCDDFLTDANFLVQHEDQLQRTKEMVRLAEQAGQQRVVDMNMPIIATLDNLIAQLTREH
jgi:hypothetical protein